MDTIDNTPAWGPRYAPDSPLGILVGRISDKWALMIMATLESGPKRFSELAAALSGVTGKVLTETLRALERDGLIARQVIPATESRVEYSLTELGGTLCPVLDSIRNWAETNIDRVVDSRSRFDQPQEPDGESDAQAPDAHVTQPHRTARRRWRR